MKHIKIIAFLLIVLFSSSCTFMYVPLIPVNPQVREARFLLSDSQGLSLETEQLRLDMTIKEVPESDWLAVQWFNPLSKEIASNSKWLEVDPEALAESKEISFLLPENITLTPGYWRAVVSYQGRLIRQFGFDYVVAEEEEAVTNLNEDDIAETNSDESSNEATDSNDN